MAINSNIPLGIRPIQQPNMLGMAGQAMALQAARQEMEDNEGVRNYFATPANQRGDISQIMHTKSGRAVSETLSQNAQRDLKTQLDSLGAAKANVFMARDPASLADYIKGIYTNSPAGKLLSTFAPLDKALAAIPSDPTAFKEYQKNFGLTTDNIVINETSRANNAATNATSSANNSATIAAAQFRHFNPNLQILETDNGRVGVNPQTLQSYQVGAPGSASQVPPAFMPQTNNVRGGGGGGGNVNALNQQPNGQPPISVNAMNQNPVQPFAQLSNAPKQSAGDLVGYTPDVNGGLTFIKGGPNDPAVIAKKKYAETSGTANVQRDQSTVLKATASMENLPKLNETIDVLNNSDAITGFGADLVKNIERVKAKFSNDKQAGKIVSDTEILDALLGSDVFPMIQSLGVGAKGMDTPAEREFLRKVMTGEISMNKDTLIRMTETRRDIAERSIDLYNKQVENGTLNRYFESSGQPPKYLEKPTYAPKPKEEIVVPSAAIEMLRSNPSLKNDFDKKYGKGAAARSLGK